MTAWRPFRPAVRLSSRQAVQPGILPKRLVPRRNRARRAAFVAERRSTAQTVGVGRIVGVSADRHFAIALQPTWVILETRVHRTARAVAGLATSFAATTTDGCHVLAIAAHCDAAFATCFTRLARIELMRGTLGVGGLATLARDLALFASIHRREAAIASGPPRSGGRSTRRRAILIARLVRHPRSS